MVFRNSTVIIKEHFIQRDVLKAGRSPVIKFFPQKKKRAAFVQKYVCGITKYGIVSHEESERVKTEVSALHTLCVYCY